MDANYGSDLHVLWKDASLIDSPPFSHLPDRLLWTRAEYLKRGESENFSQICIRPRANNCPALSIRNLTFVRLEWCDSGNQVSIHYISFEAAAYNLVNFWNWLWIVEQEIGGQNQTNESLSLTTKLTLINSRKWAVSETEKKQDE